MLYVGRARDLRARLRSYFRTDRQRPAVEAALGALERIEWRVLGSELEAALDELRLIRELRPPANARGSAGRASTSGAAARGSWRRESPSASGGRSLRPRSRGRARARGASARGARLARRPLARRGRACAGRCAELRYEDAARLRDRIAALEAVARRARTLERLRRAGSLLLVPAGRRASRARSSSRGRVVAVRTLAPGAGAGVELDAGLAEASADGASRPEDADDLLLVAQFLRRPPPELRVVPLERVVRAAA